MRRADAMLWQPAESYPADSLDPSEIAQGVRQIAHDLHQILRKTTSCLNDLIVIEQRIDALRMHTHGTPMIAIDRWLDNSQAAIRARVDAEQTALKDIYSTTRRFPDCVKSR